MAQSPLVNGDATGWLPAGTGYEVALTGGRIVARNAQGVRLKSMPVTAQLLGTPAMSLPERGDSSDERRLTASTVDGRVQKRQNSGTSSTATTPNQASITEPSRQ